MGVIGEEVLVPTFPLHDALLPNNTNLLLLLRSPHPRQQPNTNNPPSLLIHINLLRPTSIPCSCRRHRRQRLVESVFTLVSIDVDTYRYQRTHWHSHCSSYCYYPTSGRTKPQIPSTIPRAGWTPTTLTQNQNQLPRALH